jgi:hypothetical protein
MLDYPPIFFLYVPWIKSIIFFFKRPTNALECVNVILLHSIIQHVLATCGHFQGGEHKEYNYNQNVSESVHSKKWKKKVI